MGRGGSPAAYITPYLYRTSILFTFSGPPGDAKRIEYNIIYNVIYIYNTHKLSLVALSHAREAEFIGSLHSIIGSLHSSQRGYMLEPFVGAIRQATRTAAHRICLSEHSFQIMMFLALHGDCLEHLELTIHNGQTRLHRLLEDRDAPYNVSVDAAKAIVQQHYLLGMIIIQRYDYTPCHVCKPLG